MQTLKIAIMIIALILYAWDFSESASMHNSYILCRKWHKKQNKTKQNPDPPTLFSKGIGGAPIIFLGLYTGWPKNNGTAYFR